MLMTDGEIRSAVENGEMGISEFAEHCLQPASYDLRIGSAALRSGDEAEIDVVQAKSIALKAGQFALITTRESVRLPAHMAGHIGVRSYYTRKGLVLLSGLQIDPGWEGNLVLGVYNASPRRLILDYDATFSTVEFHRLAVAAENPYEPGPEQKIGRIPRVDKDYLRTIETETLSEIGESVRALSQNVGALTSNIKIIGGIAIVTFGAVIAFGLAAVLK